MNEETIDLIIILCIMVGVIILGIIMLWATRWARLRNIELNKAQGATQKEAAKLAVRAGKLPIMSTAYWAGNLSKSESVLGKILAILVIVVFSVFLGFACYVAWKII